jgi:arginine decarboxylase
MAKSASKPADPLRRWTVRDAMETYGVAHWGSGHFSINTAGNLTVAGQPSGPTIDLKQLVDDLHGRGIQTPMLVRFTDLLKARVDLIHGAFERAMADYEYAGGYRGVYPIKVNQTRRVVEELIAFGKPYHYGLEAGSKPELLAVMAMLEDEHALIICNGYKDENYIETALLASKLGNKVIIVVEKPGEVDLINKVATQTGIAPTIGIRVRLSTRGAGKWEQSGGDRSKFGLSANEILGAVEKLRGWGLLEQFQLLHFHLGSQISAIRSIKDALREGGRFYVELRKLGCSGLRYFDVGGGLGVDYDGSQTNFPSSMNYTVQEYANDIVAALYETCEAEAVPQPTIVSESGRAVVAHHSVLVVDTLGVTEFSSFDDEPAEPAEDADAVAHNLWDTYQGVSRKNALEYYHDAVEYKDQVLQLFNLGHLSLELRVYCERLFWATCQKISSLVRTMHRVHEDLQGLEKALSDTYFCNFSMFQSLPDAWAVDQLFPIMPIHRLNEEPTRRAVLADITCDSDGKIDEFIDVKDVKSTLELHALRPGERYLIGIFLSGAYQEILGDMHNLFGDSNSVYVSIDGEGGYSIDEVITGDTVTDVLRYVDFSPEDLVKRLRRNVEIALRQQRISLDESRKLIQRYRDGLAGYTYLEQD